MNRYFLKSLSFVMLFVTGFVMINAQTILQGTVKDSDGNPQAFAGVSLPEQDLWTTADENGMYLFDSVEAGTSLLEVDESGFQLFQASVQIEDGVENTHDVELSVDGVLQLDDIVVTGVGNPKASIESSISVSTLKQEEIKQGAPRTTAEIFRTIPGLRSESSGGDGNSNITVRGIPVSAGGSRYLLIQEDGLPVLMFGDVAFGTQDQFLRFDNNVGRVEALRGGSASVLTSNSPAGIINFISKTGKKEGGSVATTVGVDYKEFRTDFEYGAPIGDDMNFHVGGFYRLGDGPRETGYTSNNGGQFKMNFTKKFDKGYVRLYTKLLNDRTAAYMPMPMQVSGTNSNPDWSSIANYDALHGSLQTPYLLRDRTIGGDGNILTSDVSDGMHANSKSIGAELSFNLGDGWKVKNNGRFSFNKGQFIAPFPASVGSYNDIIGSVAGYNTATYAGTNTAASTSANYMLIHLFNTKLNNFNNFVNDLNISKKIGTANITAGLFKSNQKIDKSWHWNSYLMQVNDDNARLVDVYDVNGDALTSNGLLAYGIPGWGNCCSRNYNTAYDITAPYVNVEVEVTEGLNIDGGLRYDIGNVSGYFAGGTGQTAPIDMNQNGQIDANEQNVAVVGDNVTPVDYEYDNLSYSVGANYRINKSNAVFARASKGGTAAADRILFSGYEYTNTDDPALEAVKVNTVSQVEVGYKLRGAGYFLNTTLFQAKTIESNYEATTQTEFDNTYESLGIELDGYYKIAENFDVRGGLTYTKAEIKESLNADNVGNTPRRLPDFMYSISPAYRTDNFGVGALFTGASKSFAQDNNDLVMDGYLIVNPFVSYNLDNGLGFTLSANNILDSLAVTEVEEGSITENTTNFVRARPLTGRSISLRVQYSF